MKRSRIAAFESLEERALLSTFTPRSMVVVQAAQGPPEIDAPASQDLKITLQTDRMVYRRGQAVVMILTETNTGQQSVNVALGPSTDGFFVTRKGRQIWSSNSGVQPLFETLRTLGPGQSLQLTATWDGRSNNGPASTPAGPLVVHSQLAGSPDARIRILPT